MAGGESGMTSSAPSLPPPCPRSPPPYPDLYGKRRDLAKLQMLERERSFLEEELKFVEGLQPASGCCKEVVDFVASKSEPLVPVNPKINRSCGLRRWLCGSCCFRFSWLRCCAGCSFHLRLLECCCFNLCDCSPCRGCSVPKWQCSCPTLPCCCTKISCCKGCCKFKFPSCPSSHCCKCKCSCPKSQDVCFCYGCIKNCCDPTCCMCY
ncbi:hypothetical protein Nepgr_005978 [Nepenthes gracilis]|uniref:Guanine nucleotide-binding protein subunit gamma 3-like n=1 Tax=Nepenthes gracilis TaxID=150966 RepID=A0AAD3XGX4_NEPGR|nr:hypothetical protein Nepgr_005978 [Nepenthes gracilis]